MDEIRYDEKVGRALLVAARRCLMNAASTLDDAALLISQQRTDRGFALAILAQEEFSKCFLLCNCAAQRRWDGEVYSSLIHHEKKQALVEVMLNYVEWFEKTNSFALALNATALIPAPVSCMPDMSEFQQWVVDAKRKVVKKRSIDRAKQRALYVSVGVDGAVASEPRCTEREAETELERARSFQRVAEMQLKHVGDRNTGLHA